MDNILLASSPLGKETHYSTTYAPELLFPLPRKTKRDEIHVPTPLPFQGADIWTSFEFSWLNAKGKPIVSLVEFSFPCASPFMVESKSFKLYLHSFHQTRFESEQQVLEHLRNDLSAKAGATVNVTLIPLSSLTEIKISNLSGICLDDLELDIDTYNLKPDFLMTKKNIIEETVYSNLLKSNCLITKQSDWASIQIHYRGPRIDHAGLLRYLVSFRKHTEFNEQCVERIFMDIFTRCKPEQLTVYARYTRRGGLDINPFRSTHLDRPPHNLRLARQ